ncbi:MAG: hypothetical protein AB4038_17965 [Prochloraceae cyanobacterium]
MNTAVNRSSEFPPSSDNQVREPSHLPNNPENKQIGDSQNNPPSISAEVNETTLTRPQRKQPIPPPSDPKQYRAIGLIEGNYQRSEEQITQGKLLMTDGTAIEAVLLGRTISLVKNHLDLAKPHLWVVYPRTRQQEDHLHLQIVGVWEPETLNPEQHSLSTDSQTEKSAKSESIGESLSEPRPGYFSIRGEVIFYAQDKETAIVKIQQSAKKESEKSKFFKLKLKGTLPEKSLGHFWDLQVQLQAGNLVIQEAVDIGLLITKRKKIPYNKGGKKPLTKRDAQRRSPSSLRPIPKGKKVEGNKQINKPSLSRPVPKATKRSQKKDNN